MLTKRKNRTSCLSILQKSSNFQFKYRNRLKSNKDIYKKISINYKDMLRTLLIVALGGGVGSALRYAVSKFVQDNMSGAFPYHTFAVNIVGCLLIGLFYGLAARGHLGNNTTTLLLTTGLCGGFTTFSTFCNENIALLRGDNAFVALLYIASSMFCGLLAVMFGYFIIDYITKA